jgi:hypothetical protein
MLWSVESIQHGYETQLLSVLMGKLWSDNLEHLHRKREVIV